MMPEDDWRARDDARTLAAASEVLADKERHEKAILAAKSLVAEKEEQSKAMKRVAGVNKQPSNSFDSLSKEFKKMTAKI